jgi:hypothetical protein
LSFENKRQRREYYR